MRNHLTFTSEWVDMAPHDPQVRKGRAQMGGDHRCERPGTVHSYHIDPLVARYAGVFESPQSAFTYRINDHDIECPRAQERVQQVVVGVCFDQLGRDLVGNMLPQVRQKSGCLHSW